MERDMDKSLAIFEAAKALSFCTLDVTNDAVRVSAGIPVDMVLLSRKFITLNAQTNELAELMRLKKSAAYLEPHEKAEDAT